MPTSHPTAAPDRQCFHGRNLRDAAAAGDGGGPGRGGENGVGGARVERVEREGGKKKKSGVGRGRWRNHMRFLGTLAGLDL